MAPPTSNARTFTTWIRVGTFLSRRAWSATSRSLHSRRGEVATCDGRGTESVLARERALLIRALTFEAVRRSDGPAGASGGGPDIASTRAATAPPTACACVYGAWS